MLYRDCDSTKPREVKDIHDFPTSFLAHLERARNEKDQPLVKAYSVEDDDTFKNATKRISPEIYEIMFIVVMWLR